MRTKNVIKNYITDFIPQIIIMILGMLKIKVLLKYIGHDTLGLYQVFTQFMAYITVAEGGLIGAAVYRLHKPIVETDNQKVKEILNATRNVFMVISIIITILGIVISFIIPYFVQNNPFNNTYITINFIIYLISEIITYLMITNRIVYNAYEKNYKINLILQGSVIIKSILEMAIVYFGGNITQIFFMYIGINVILNTTISLKANKEFKFLPKTKKKDFSLVKDIKNLIVHKIAGIISNNVDIVIISSSKELGLASVVIYSTYNVIVNSLKIVIDKIRLATESSVGNLLYENKERSYKIFKEYNAMVHFIATFLGIPLLFAINYFIDIWYEGEIQTDISIAFLFTLIFIYNTIRIPLCVYTTSIGMFKETKICAILEGIINLVLSLIFVRFWGIIGVLIATIVSLIVSEYMIKPRIIYKNIFHKKVSSYYVQNSKFDVYIIISIIMVVVLIRKINISNLGLWFIISTIVFVINLVATSIYYSLIRENEFIKRTINLIINKIRCKLMIE